MQFYLDEKRGLLVYPARDHFLLRAIPEAREINDEFTAVPRSLRNSILLRRFGWPVPPVVTEQSYDWPIEPGRKPLDHQRVMTNFMALHPRSFNLSDPGCVDGETEFLTPAGWKRIDCYNNELVGQYNLEGHVEFVKAKYVQAPCAWMYRLKTSRGIDQKLSEEHRVLYINMNNRLSITTASEMVKEHGAKKQGWRGRFITTFTTKASGFPLLDAELRVMIAVIADGHFPNKSSRCIISVKKTRKKERLRDLLNAANIQYQEQDLPWRGKEGYTRFSFVAPRREKEFGSFYWLASIKQLEIITDECWRWDGSAGQGNRGVNFSSVSKQSADFIQYAFAATGYTASIQQQPSNKWCPQLWTVLTRKKSALLGLGNGGAGITVEATSDGKKYCFEVPSGFLVFRRNGCIFVTGNTMKTLSALWAADFLMRYTARVGQDFRCLIICPLTIVQDVWGNAIFRNFLGRRSFEILHGAPERRLSLLAKKADFSIINFDGVGVGAHTRKKFELDGFSKELANRKDIRLVIVDEASAYSDASTKRHRLARLIFADRPYVWQLTGSPTPQYPTDAYGLARLVDKHQGKSFTRFRDETMFQMSAKSFKWFPRRDGYEAARRLLQPAVRFSLDQVWDGPPMTFQSRSVELTDEQKKHLATLKRDLIVETRKGKLIDAVNEAAARTKYLQITQGAIYDADHREHVIDCRPRLTELEAIIEGTERKVVVFIALTSVLYLVKLHLQKRWGVEHINGDVDPKDRPGVIQKFATDSEVKVICCDPQSTSHGINDFVVADTAVWYSPIEKAELWVQGNGRVRRPGQTHPTTCFQLAATPLEREIFRRLETNTSLQGALLQMVERGEL